MANPRMIHFSGNVIETTVTDKAEAVDAWVRSIYARNNRHQNIIVGLDCEWRPNTSSFMNNKTATMQLCVDTKCLIIQLMYLDYIPLSLINFLRDPNVTFAGVEVERDATKLGIEYGLVCNTTADVRELAMSRWPSMFYKKPGLKDIASSVVGLNMPKPVYVSMSDWQSRVLEETQVEYACIDAYASYRIGHFLLSES